MVRRVLGKKLMVEHTKHTANLPLDREKAPNLTLVAVISVFSTGITLRQVNMVYISSGRISITVCTYVLGIMVVSFVIKTLALYNMVHPHGAWITE